MWHFNSNRYYINQFKPIIHQPIPSNHRRHINNDNNTTSCSKCRVYVRKL
uniref:Uncharacterized protein n=1 Tax=Arundo donax TaxID=35708 RepID=A0A0A8YUA8_ARUDO